MEGLNRIFFEYEGLKNANFYKGIKRKSLRGIKNIIKSLLNSKSCDFHYAKIRHKIHFLKFFIVC